MYRLIRLYCWFAVGHNTIGTAIIRINIVQQHVVRSRSWTVSPKGAGFCCQAMIFRPNANPFFFIFIFFSSFRLLFAVSSLVCNSCWLLVYFFHLSESFCSSSVSGAGLSPWASVSSGGTFLQWLACAPVVRSFTLTAVGVVRSTWWGPVHLGFLQCFLFRSFIGTQPPGFRLCNWPSAGCGSAAFTCV